jgi:alpha-1,3-fucosyltransferase
MVAIRYFLFLLFVAMVLTLMLISNTERYTDNYSAPAFESFSRGHVNQKQIPTNSQLTSVGYKNILIWNEADRTETANFGIGHNPFVEHKCDVSDCAIFTQSTSMLPFEEYDAVIIHMLFLKLFQLPDFERRREHQRFIFLTQETPVMMPLYISSLENYFNWTMTYKRNSDIQFLYGRIEPKRSAPKTQEEIIKMIARTSLPLGKNYAANKTRPIVWMVSHCLTSGNRETYVRQLSKFIPVDIYGKCGNLSCPRNEANWISDPKCYDMLQEKYKFYLSFENAFCTDYVTEKFFEIMNHNMIPIVYGAANYSEIAPPHSYINAMDFTPERLARYLTILDANDTLYNEYFWWKNHYRVESGEPQMARHGFCDLCKKLHQDQSVKYYSEIKSEWHPNTQCRHLSSSWESSPQNYLTQFLSWLLFLIQFIY